MATVGYVTDQLTKAWASSTLTPDKPREVVGTLLQLRLIRNPGAAFSIATNATWLLSLIAVAVICATVYFARRLRSKPWACALGLLIGGALGNLTDRFFRTPGGGSGHVVDFLELPHWPIFNVADICVTSAACLIALLALLGIGVDGTRSHDVVDDEDGDAHHIDAHEVDAHDSDGTHLDAEAADAADTDAAGGAANAAAADRHTAADGPA
ncbi:signal peptidase II [Rudaeicoccus suwonensis]|uniref:Lipoprotein signal peptidase n=1 Tax=Rudaeicoccus suwonensis TaxID=657409 RepID=A0A561EC95_9MICO|nr:signal peptidase II [Rudaeicoccus suwonensis]TWE13230.1 signal peptidase II [Rudaeicoccus suwonensis]